MSWKCWGYLFDKLFLDGFLLILVGAFLNRDSLNTIRSNDIFRFLYIYFSHYLSYNDILKQRPSMAGPIGISCVEFSRRLSEIYYCSIIILLLVRFYNYIAIYIHGIVVWNDDYSPFSSTCWDTSYIKYFIKYIY